MTTIQAEEAQAAWTELSEYRGTEANAESAEATRARGKHRSGRSD